MSDESRRSGCTQVGCFGCLGLLAVVLLGFLVVGVFGLVSSRTPVDRVVEREGQRLPPAETPPPPPLTEATPEQLEDAGAVASLELGAGPPLEFPASGVGTVVLDLRMGEFFLEPGPEGSEIEVEAEYDASRFRLVRELEETADGNWTYLVRLEPKRRGFFSFGDQEPARIEIRLPRGRPLRLEGDLRMGTSRLEVGGLWLETIDLDLRMGEHELSVSEPTPAPLESVALSGRMGELRVRELGNASPRSITATQRMGQLTLDLDGDWRADATLDLSCRMGQCQVDVPRDLRVRSQGVDVFLGEAVDRSHDDDELPEGAPTLEIRASGAMGQIEVR